MPASATVQAAQAAHDKCVIHRPGASATARWYAALAPQSLCGQYRLTAPLSWKVDPSTPVFRVPAVILFTMSVGLATIHFGFGLRFQPPPMPVLGDLCAGRVCLPFFRRLGLNLPNISFVAVFAVLVFCCLLLPLLLLPPACLSAGCEAGHGEPRSV